MIKSSSVMMFSYSLFILFQVEGKLEPGVEKKGFHIKQLPSRAWDSILEGKYLVAWNRQHFVPMFKLWLALPEDLGCTGWASHPLQGDPSQGGPGLCWTLQSYFLYRVPPCHRQPFKYVSSASFRPVCSFIMYRIWYIPSFNKCRCCVCLLPL